MVTKTKAKAATARRSSKPVRLSKKSIKSDTPLFLSQNKPFAHRSIAHFKNTMGSMHSQTRIESCAKAALAALAARQNG
jgi:hypothetical protein